ncbi:MAG TPA: SPFH domain-containing protein [Bacteroidia bacterium]|nr:SPFH domain-containing protein [Bacteroidia bacterium]
MSIFSGISHELIDIIEWTDDSSDTLVWRFPRWQNEIKNGAKLVVRQAQAAVFVNEGKIADVYQPGTYTLETNNMPILTTLRGWKYGFNSPFKVEVYFVNTRQYTDQKWGTKNPIMLNDPNFGMVDIRAFGTYAFRVADPKKFMEEIVGTNSAFTTEDIGGQLKSTMVSKLTSELAKSGFGVDKFSANVEEISDFCKTKVTPVYEGYGLTLTQFVLENVSMPPEIQKEIYQYSRLGKVDMSKLAQMNAANAIQTAAANQGGIAGMGMGLGVGVGMGNIMANTMGQATNQMQQQQQAAPAPPPIPQAIQYFVAVDGKQTGPFNEQQLAQMVQGGTLTRESMIWKNGMAAWQQAAQVAETAGLFNNAPPPIPS